MERGVRDILTENERRQDAIHRPFDPLTGEGSVGKRVKLVLPDFSIPVQWIPEEMADNGLVRQVSEYGSIRDFVVALYDDQDLDEETLTSEVAKVSKRLIGLRIYYDVAFWCALLVKIKNKGGGDDVRFELNRPQREVLFPAFEEDRLAGRPCRIIVDKTRQWGCSTGTEMYFGWRQLVRERGLNSLIVGHVSATSAEVEDMYKKMLAEYPLSVLEDPLGTDGALATPTETAEKWVEEEDDIGILTKDGKKNDDKWTSVGGKQNIHRIPQRNCKVKLGTAMSPENSRGGDYNLVHCTEVGLWLTADGHRPADIVQGATGGMLYAPNTMIVLESTAKGVGNYFHQEYVAAVEGKSQFKAIFVAWWQVDQNSIYFADEAEKQSFASWLWKHRKDTAAEDERHESGEYLYWLWEQGATLEAIRWYIIERMKYGSSAAMREEYPTTWQESFVNSGANVFDARLVDKLEKSCRPAKWRGEVEGSVSLGGQGSTDGTWYDRRGIGDKKLLQDLHFVEDECGHLQVWAQPEADEDGETVRDRYLVVVDIGGRGEKADWSVICVFDRLGMLEGGKPSVVAQWYGHIDMDLLAWKSAQIAAYYNNALLVIESNTLETKDRERIVDGEQAPFILLQIKDAYDNLYTRRRSEEDIREGVPAKYGFHTNTSTKPMIIATLIKIVREQAYIERDKECLHELRFYERRQNGSYGAVIGKHDDKLMTRAIGLHICYYEMPMPVIESKTVRKVSRQKIVRRG